MHFANSPTPERMSLNEVAKHLRVHLGTVYRWTLHGVRGRQLRSHLVGGRRYVYPADLNDFLHADEDRTGKVDSRRAEQAQARLESFGATKQRRAKK